METLLFAELSLDNGQIKNLEHWMLLSRAWNPDGHIVLIGDVRRRPSGRRIHGGFSGGRQAE